MLSPDKLKEAFENVEDENWALRAFLKEQNWKKVGEIVHKLHRELFKDYDCISCSNCCEVILPLVKKNEIREISHNLGITEDEFKRKYLVKTDEGLMINNQPCPFLNDNGCEVYEYRPESCKEYPFTEKAEITSRLINLVENCKVCPVVYEIFERLKKHYGAEFEDYKTEFQSIWGNIDDDDFESLDNIGDDEDYEDWDDFGFYEDPEDFEDWEEDAKLYYQEDFENLIDYRLHRVKKYPDSIYWQWRLGEALFLNKEYDKAIDLLSNLHKMYPDDINIQHTLLDALFANGNDETAIDWIVEPKIMRLGKDFLDNCYNIIKSQKQPMNADELYISLMGDGYLSFDTYELIKYMGNDSKFNFTGDLNAPYDCYVSINKVGRNEPCPCGSDKKYKKCCGQ